jgi:hypothetical protein
MHRTPAPDIAFDRPAHPPQRCVWKIQFGPIEVCSPGVTIDVRQRLHRRLDEYPRRSAEAATICGDVTASNQS